MPSVREDPARVREKKMMLDRSHPTDPLPPACRLGCHEREAVAAHLKRLSAADRARRFDRNVTDEEIDAYIDGLDFDRGWLLAVRNGGGDVVSLVHAVPFDYCGARVVEAALSTDRTYRHRGLSRLLFAEVVDRAQSLGACRVLSQCPSRNAPMRELLGALGGECEVTDHDGLPL
jgi:GNAT superfamily N-acetyltransferase